MTTQFIPLDGQLFSGKSSWTPETQPNDALRRRLVEFLVFNSAFGRQRHWLISHHTHSSSSSCYSSSIDTLESDPTWKLDHFPVNQWMMNDMTVMINKYDVILISACVCRRPSWTPETQPNGAVRRRLVEFLVFNSIYLKKSVSPNAEKVVHHELKTVKHRVFWGIRALH